jgi:hypothetical protein
MQIYNLGAGGFIWLSFLEKEHEMVGHPNIKYFDLDHSIAKALFRKKKLNKQAGISLLPSTPSRMNGPQTM